MEFDVETGVLWPTGCPAGRREVTEKELDVDRRSRAMVQDIIGYLASLLAPVAYAASGTTPSDYPRYPRDYLLLANHTDLPLKELEALHRILFRPRWSVILRNAIESAATRRVEAELRQAWKPEKRAAHQNGRELAMVVGNEARVPNSRRQPEEYGFDPPEPVSVAEILNTLKSLPPRLVGTVPMWLTANMIKELIAGTKVGPGGRGGGWTPDTAVEMIAAANNPAELWRRP